MDELLSLLDKFSETNPGPWRSAARQIWTALRSEVGRSVAADVLPDNESFIKYWRLIADPRLKRGLDAYYCTYREITVDTERIQNNLLLLLASAATAVECNRALSQDGSASTSNWNTATYTVPDFLRAEYDNRFGIKGRPTLRYWTLHWLGEVPRPDHSVTVPLVAVTNQGCLCDFVFDRCEAPETGLVEDPTVALRPFSKALLSLLNAQYEKRAPGVHVVWKFEFRPNQRAGPETPVDGDSFGAGIAAGLELLASGRRFDTRSILTASVKPNDGLTSVFLIDKKLAAIPRSHRVGLAHNQPKDETGPFEKILDIHRLATVQDAVAFALGSPVPGMGRQTTKLKRYLVGKNPRARAEAAEAAAKAGEVELLNDALCHSSEEVRIAAAEAVCRFKVVAALPCLVSGLRGNGKRRETALIPGLVFESIVGLRRPDPDPGKNWVWQFGQQAIGPLVDEILRKDMNPEERTRFATALAGCLNNMSASQLLTNERLFRRETQAMCVVEAALRSGVDLSPAEIEPRLAAISCEAADLVNYNTAYPARASAWLLESSIRNETWVHSIVRGWLRTVCTRRSAGNNLAEDLLFRSAFEMGAVTRQDLLDLANEIEQLDLPVRKDPHARAPKLRTIAGSDAMSTPPEFPEGSGVEPVTHIADAAQSEQEIRGADPEDLAFTEFTVKLSDTWPSFLEWLAHRLQDTTVVSIREDQGRGNSFYHSGRPGQLHYPIEVLCEGHGVPITLEIDLVAEWLHPFVLGHVSDQAGIPWDSSLFPIKVAGGENESRIEESYGSLRDAEYWVLFAATRSRHGLGSPSPIRSTGGEGGPSAQGSPYIDDTPANREPSGSQKKGASLKVFFNNGWDGFNPSSDDDVLFTVNLNVDLNYVRHVQFLRQLKETAYHVGNGIAVRPDLVLDPLEDRASIGVCLGSSQSGQQTTEEYHALFHNYRPTLPSGVSLDACDGNEEAMWAWTTRVPDAALCPDRPFVLPQWIAKIGTMIEEWVRIHNAEINRVINAAPPQTGGDTVPPELSEGLGVKPVTHITATEQSEQEVPYDGVSGSLRNGPVARSTGSAGRGKSTISDFLESFKFAFAAAGLQDGPPSIPRFLDLRFVNLLAWTSELNARDFRETVTSHDLEISDKAFVLECFHWLVEGFCLARFMTTGSLSNEPTPLGLPRQRELFSRWKTVIAEKDWESLWVGDFAEALVQRLVSRAKENLDEIVLKRNLDKSISLMHRCMRQGVAAYRFLMLPHAAPAPSKESESEIEPQIESAGSLSSKERRSRNETLRSSKWASLPRQVEETSQIMYDENNFEWGWLVNLAFGFASFVNLAHGASRINDAEYTGLLNLVLEPCEHLGIDCGTLPLRSECSTDKALSIGGTIERGLRATSVRFAAPFTFFWQFLLITGSNQDPFSLEQAKLGLDALFRAAQLAGLLDTFSKEAIHRLAYEPLTSEERKKLQNDFITWARSKDNR